MIFPDTPNKDENLSMGDSTDITNEIVLKVKNTKIYDGYIFKTASKKTVNCYYNGKTIAGIGY